MSWVSSRCHALAPLAAALDATGIDRLFEPLE
jgi:hypothetical protein